MNMFDLEKMEKVMGYSIENKLHSMVEEIRNSLNNPIYEKIIKSFSINIEDSDLKFRINLFDDFEAQNQDIVRVLTYGGVFEKTNKEVFLVPPNMILLRYFS